MAEYKAAPNYSVVVGSGKVTFDHAGLYSTKAAREIKALDALVPRYVKRIDEPKTEEKPASSEK